MQQSCLKLDVLSLQKEENKDKDFVDKLILQKETMLHNSF